MTITATALIQCVTRSQPGWMSAPAGAPAAMACDAGRLRRHTDLWARRSSRRAPCDAALAGVVSRLCENAGDPGLWLSERSASTVSSSIKNREPGNFFEDFRLGQSHPPRDAAHRHAGDVALYTALFGARFAVQSSDAFAQAIGYPRAPIDDLLVFHVVFGKTVPDISLNAVANLGYADCRFLAPVYPGDTLTRRLRGDRPQGELQPQDRRRLCPLDRLQPATASTVLELCALGDGAQARRERAGRRAITCRACPTRRARRRSATPARALDVAAYDIALAGSPHRFGDYAVGEKIDHVDGMTVEEAEHQIATRLYQNTAQGPFRPVRGGAGPLRPAADLWRPRHLAGARAVVQRARQRVPHRRDQWRPPRRAAVRGRHGLRLVRGAGEGRAPGPQRRRRAAPAHGRDEGPALRGLPATSRATTYDPAVMLDLDYWVLMPR